jgi:type IV secretory pathway VirB10-like protein
VQAQADPLPGFLDLMQKQQALSERVATQPVTPPVPPQTPQKPARQAWRVKPTDITLRKEGEVKGEASKAEKETLARQGQANELIKPSTWARPAKPWVTLYMDQKIPGQLLDAVNSDEPGINNIETTVPIFDGAGWGYEILPKGSKVTIRQEGKPNFGANTLNVKVVQIRLPGLSGTVVKFPGSVGDENGANGMRGKTNRHLGSLFLATGINALVSLGSNSLAGTPNGYYANPAQQTARDVSQSVSRDVESITKEQLKVPPTITKKAGEFVTIQMEENITFSRPATVVR